MSHAADRSGQVRTEHRALDSDLDRTVTIFFFFLRSKSHVIPTMKLNILMYILSIYFFLSVCVNILWVLGFHVLQNSEKAVPAYL